MCEWICKLINYSEKIEFVIKNYTYSSYMQSYELNSIIILLLSVILCCSVLIVNVETRTAAQTIYQVTSVCQICLLEIFLYDTHICLSNAVTFRHFQACPYIFGFILKPFIVACSLFYHWCLFRPLMARFTSYQGYRWLK